MFRFHPKLIQVSLALDSASLPVQCAGGQPILPPGYPPHRAPSNPLAASSPPLRPAACCFAPPHLLEPTAQTAAMAKPPLWLSSPRETPIPGLPFLFNVSVFNTSLKYPGAEVLGGSLCKLRALANNMLAEDQLCKQESRLGLIYSHYTPIRAAS